MSIAKSERRLPLATMEALMMHAGAIRVSENAKVELKHILEEYAQGLAGKACMFAKHAGRKTIKKQDIVLAQQS